MLRTQSNLPTHNLNQEVVNIVVDFFAHFREEVCTGSMTTNDVVVYVRKIRPRTRTNTIWPVIVAFGPVGEDDAHWLATGHSKRYGRYE